jgi:hypothetical protein
MLPFARVQLLRHSGMKGEGGGGGGEGSAAARDARATRARANFILFVLREEVAMGGERRGKGIQLLEIEERDCKCVWVGGTETESR